MKTQTTHSNKHIAKLVERGYALQYQLLLLNTEFAEIKEKLKAEAAARPTERVPLLEKNSEGDQWIATGKECECRIVFPSPKIKTCLDPLEPDFKTVKALAGDHFHVFFHRVISYELTDKKTFRDDVNLLLAEAAATQLLNLCTTPSEPRAYWKSLRSPAKS